MLVMPFSTDLQIKITWFNVCFYGSWLIFLSIGCPCFLQNYRNVGEKEFISFDLVEQYNSFANCINHYIWLFMSRVCHGNAEY